MRPLRDILQDWQFWGLMTVFVLGVMVVSSDLSFTIKCQGITLLAVLATPASLMGRRGHPTTWQMPNLHSWIYIGSYVASYLLANSFWLVYWGYIPAENRYAMAVKIYTLHFAIMVVMAWGIHLFGVIWRDRLPNHDLQSKEILVILFLAELFAALEYLECKIPEPDAVFVAKTLGQIAPEYACQSALSPLAPYAAPLVTSCYLIWVNIAPWRRSSR